MTNPPGPGLNARQRAQARQAAYALFSQLYLFGVTDDSLATVRQLPELARHIPDDHSRDALAADHYDQLIHNLNPHESIFLGVDGLVGGEIAAVAAAELQRLGYYRASATAEADHLGHVLGGLALLQAREAMVRGAGQPVLAQQSQTVQRQFLSERLLRWLSPCVIAMRSAGHLFYAALADLTLALVGDHLQDLGPGLAADADWSLPTRPDILGDERTALPDIAAYLLTPAYVGLVLTPATIRDLGRRLALPRGFGGRSQLLTNILRAAAQYDQFGLVLTALGELATDWESGYRAIRTDWPLLTPFVRPWEERAAGTRGFVEAMHQEMAANGRGSANP